MTLMFPVGIIQKALLGFYQLRALCSFSLGILAWFLLFYAYMLCWEFCICVSVVTELWTLGLRPLSWMGVTGLSPLWSQAVQGSGESEQTVGCLLVCCASCIVQCLCCQHVSESQSRHRSRWHRRLAASQFCLLVQQDGDKNQTPSRAEKVPEQNKVNANNFRQQILSGFMAPRTLKI